MALYQKIKLLALDIGGVVAAIDKTPVLEFCKHYSLTLNDFFDDDFLLIQKGTISPQEFLKRKNRKHGASIRSITQAFTNMIRCEISSTLLSRIKVPYFFLSDINQLHFDEVVNQLNPCDFAKKHSRLSYQVGCLKPDAKFFRAQSAGFESRIVFIDDNIHHLTAARQFNIEGRHCAHPTFLPKILDELRVI